MNLPYSDPSNPALPSPLFSDVTAVRGDHMRANNAAIFANFDFLIDLLNEFFTDSDQLTVDEILEKTTGAGVTIDGVVCKDGVVTGDLTGNADTVTNGVYTTGNQTVNGVKTFGSTIVGSINGIKETGSGAKILHKKIIDINDWNMDTTASLTVMSGLSDNAAIRTITVMIVNDDNETFHPLNFIDGSGVAHGGFYLGVTEIFLTRVSGGFFDTVNFDSTSYNRGWIVIEYVD